MKPIFFWSGTVLIAAGAGLPLLLPSAPAALQSNAIFQPIGSFVINWQNWIVLLGLVLMFLSIFLG